MITLKRACQAISLGTFLVLLLTTTFPLALGAGLAVFQRLDPLLAFGTDLACRSLAVPVLPALAVLVSGLFLGRAFCGHLCPMGTTLDVAGACLGRKKRLPGGSSRRDRDASLKPLKYLVLTAMLVSAALGVSWIAWGSPLSLATRFYALLAFPGTSLGAAELLDPARPLAKELGWYDLAYAKLGTQRFAAQFATAALFAGLFLLCRPVPRFWCRYLCPAGAMLALFSRRPLVARRVSEACTGCGACRQACPMGAIPENPRCTLGPECLLCQTCRRVCPEGAVSFGKHSVAPETPPSPKTDSAPTLPGRRAFLAATSGGLALAALGLTGLAEQAGGADGGGRITPAKLLRPPGAPPEPDFLRKCLRCGACMRVCPSNMLQPDWFVSGLTGLFSPLAAARRGGCQPLCNACGQVCPSGAIPPAPLEEKMWAKMGTAVIDRQKCLAWEQEKKCLVCDEVCPYDAVKFKRVEGLAVEVPHVIENRCAGCGFCERHCPVESPAIVLAPIGAVRLAGGSFREYGRGAGLDIVLRPKKTPEAPQSADEAGPNDLPPGFSE